MRLPLAGLAVFLAFGALAGCASSRLSEAELSDPGIQARLEERLRGDRSLDLRFVNIEVHDRVVTIAGSVPSWENKRDIERTARKIEGVDQVLCSLIIQE